MRWGWAWGRGRVGFGLVCFGWVGLGWVGLGWVGLGWVGLGWVGLGWVGLGWVMFDDSHKYSPASVLSESHSILFRCWYEVLSVSGVNRTT